MNKKKILTLLVTTSLLAVVGVGSTLAYFTDKTDTLTNVVTMGKVDARLVENVAERKNGTWSFTNEIIPSCSKNKGNYINVLPGDIIKKNPTVCLEPGSAEAWVRVKFKINGDKDNWLDVSIKDQTKTNPSDRTNQNDVLNQNDTQLLAKPNQGGYPGGHHGGNPGDHTGGNPGGSNETNTYRSLLETAIHDNISDKWIYDGCEYYYYKYRLHAPRFLGGNYITYLESGSDNKDATKATLFDQFTFPTIIDNQAASKEFNIEVNAELIQADHIILNTSKNKIGWYGVGENNQLGEPITTDMILPYPLKTN